MENRCIKFRQPRIVKGKFHHWHYWGYIDDNKAHFVAPLPPNTGGESYQFTGLKDKNGKGTNEVYEGDIVICSYESAPNHRFKGVIKYTAPEFYLACFWEDIDGEQCSFPVGDNNRSLARGFWSIDEILGNIHQHSNLMEKQCHKES